MPKTERQVIEGKDLPKENRLTLLFQSILDSETILTELVTNGQGKASILEKAKQQINVLNLQEKVIFLKDTFTALANPNSASQDQNKRDAALELLRVTDLTSVDPKKLTEIYTDEIEKLNEDSDPLGEIDALLEAGKIIAPFITARPRINLAWKNITLYFTENDKQIISDGIKKMQKSYRQRKLR